jgi:hypothetical protein
MKTPGWRISCNFRADYSGICRPVDNDGFWSLPPLRKVYRRECVYDVSNFLMVLLQYFPNENFAVIKNIRVESGLFKQTVLEYDSITSVS